MATTILLRRGPSIEWATANPVLNQGELGYETDTNFIKFGNGTDTWNDLPYFAGKAQSQSGTSGTVGRITVNSLGEIGVVLGSLGTSAAPGNHTHSLSSLADVLFSSLGVNDIAQWNGTRWVNRTLADAGIQPAGNYLEANQTISLTGDVVGTGTSSIATSLAEVPGLTDGTFTKVTVNTKGQVVSGDSLGAADVPDLDTSKIISGILSNDRLNDHLKEISNTGAAGIVVKTPTGGGVMTLSGSGGITITNPSGVAVGGSAVGPAITLTDTGVPAGDYANIQRMSIDAKGRVSSITAVPWEVTNPTLTQKVFTNKSTSSWWIGGANLCLSMSAWNITDPTALPANYNFGSVNITSSTYRNHPMYSSVAAGHYNVHRYSSNICTRNVFTFTCPQPSRVLIATNSTFNYASNYQVTAGHLLRFEKFVGGQWVLIQDADDGRWTRITDSTGAFSGHVSIDASSPVTNKYEKDWTILFPGAVTAASYYLNGTVQDSSFSDIFPPFEANVPHRITITGYPLATSSFSMTSMGCSAIFTLIGE